MFVENNKVVTIIYKLNQRKIYFTKIGSCTDSLNNEYISA